MIMTMGMMAPASVFCCAETSFSGFGDGCMVDKDVLFQTSLVRKLRPLILRLI